jgi:hypothetical protein
VAVVEELDMEVTMELDMVVVGGMAVVEVMVLGESMVVVMVEVQEGELVVVVVVFVAAEA